MLTRIPDFRVDGRRAIVTGAARGIGFAAASALAQGGADVTLVDRDASGLKQACGELQAAGFTCDSMILDVTDSDAVTSQLATTGPFQILVNNAGMNRPKELVCVEDEDLDAMLALNVKAAFYLTRAVVRILLAAKLSGSVINISSQMGLVGSPRRTVYCATKHAIEGLTKSLAWELGSANIRVNSLCPTFIETAFTAPMFEDATFRSWVTNRVAFGRVGRVEEIMGAILFLASDASSLMTGSALVLDGGWTAA